MASPYVANLIAVIAVLIPGYFAYRASRKKQEEIHVLVNSRLTEALEEIEKLKDQLDRLGHPQA